MKALVLGASGWIGSRLAQALSDAGVDTVGVRHGSPADPVDPRADLLEPVGLGRLIEAHRPDVVVNAAGRTSGADGVAALYRAHVEGTANLLEAIAAAAPSAHLISMGSAAEYGPSDQPISEDHPGRPTGHYGLSKLLQTRLALEVAAWSGLRVTVLRLFNAVGVGMPAGLLLSDLFARLKRIRAGEDSVLRVGDVDAVRDLVPMERIGEAVVRVARAGGPAGVLNVATGEGTRVGALVEWLRQASDFDWTVQPIAREARRSDGGRSVGDPSAFERALGSLEGPSARDAVLAAFRSEVLNADDAGTWV